MLGQSRSPVFYEPRYRANLEILRFDSSLPRFPYVSYIRNCRAALQRVTVTSSGHLPLPCIGEEIWLGL